MLYEAVWGHEQSDLGSLVILEECQNLLSLFYMWFICCQHIAFPMTPLLKCSTMSAHPSRIQTCPKNANQHPSYIQRKPPCAYAALAKATKAAKQVVKLMGAAHVSQFETDEMER